jgi:hypothetical protein
LNHLIQGALAFGDLTLEDCRVLRLPGHGAAARALTQGAIDFYAFGTTGSLPAETASGRHGLRWLDMSPENQAGWRRYEEVCPWTVMGLVQRYIGRDDGVDPFHSVRYPYNIWCWDNTAEELVYAYAKAIWDSYESYRDKHAELAHWTHETLADTESCYAPYHPGVVRLMKEEGVWTPSHERFQKTRLRQETERMALWKRTRKAASRQGIDFHSVEWKETWWKALTAAGLLR